MGTAPMLGRPCLDRRWVRVSRRPRRSVSQRRSCPGRSGSSDPDLRWRPRGPRADHAPKPPRQARVSGLRRGRVPRLTERRPRRGALGRVAALRTPARPPRPVDARARRDRGCRDDRATHRVASQPRPRVDGRGATDGHARTARDRSVPAAARARRSPRCAIRDIAVRLAGRPRSSSHGASPPGAARPSGWRARTPAAVAADRLADRRHRPARPFSPAPPPQPAATHPGPPGTGAAHEFGFEG